MAESLCLGLLNLVFAVSMFLMENGQWELSSLAIAGASSYEVVCGVGWGDVCNVWNSFHGGESRECLVLERCF